MLQQVDRAYKTPATPGRTHFHEYSRITSLHKFFHSKHLPKPLIGGWSWMAVKNGTHTRNRKAVLSHTAEQRGFEATSFLYLSSGSWRTRALLPRNSSVSPNVLGKTWHKANLTGLLQVCFCSKTKIPVVNRRNIHGKEDADQLHFRIAPSEDAWTLKGPGNSLMA